MYGENMFDVEIVSNNGVNFNVYENIDVAFLNL